MKILQILTELSPAGAERVVMELTREFKRTGHSPYVISLMPPPHCKNIENEMIKIGVHPRFIFMEKYTDLSKIFVLRRLIRELSPDIVHSHLVHPNLIARLAVAGLNIPLVNTVHVSERRPGKKIFFLLDSLSFFLCDACTAVSEATARFHEKAAHLRKGAIRCIHNGTSELKIPSPEACRVMKIHREMNNCAKMIGSVGRLDRQKGYDNLLRVMNEVSKRIPAGEVWGLILLGEGPERKNLEGLAANLPKNIMVKMPGFVPDAALEAACFDVFVMPSRYEGYGLALADAMQLGLPVVVSNVDSLPELVQSYPNAALAEFSNPEKDAETAAKIICCAAMPKCPPHIISTNREMAAKYVELYKEILDKRR